MKSKIRLLTAFLALGIACTLSPDKKPVAKVNGKAITTKEYEDEVTRNLARYRGASEQLPPGIEQRIRESVLRRLIDDAIIAQKADELKIKIPDTEIETKFKEHKDRFRTEQAFKDYLDRSHNTEANMRDDLQRNILRDRVVETMSGAVDVTDQEVTAYYEENKQRFLQPEQINASRIVMRVEATTKDVDKKALKKKMQDVLAKAKKAKADFAALAKQFSNGPEAGRGGELGWFSRGRMTPDFDNVAFTLQPGKVSDVVETKMGYEIILVGEKKPEFQRPLDEVKESIKSSILARKRNEKRREVLQTLKTGAKVETLITFDAPEAQKPSMPPGVPSAGLPQVQGQPNAPVAPQPVPQAAPSVAQPTTGQ